MAVCVVETDQAGIQVRAVQLLGQEMDEVPDGKVVNVWVQCPHRQDREVCKLTLSDLKADEDAKRIWLLERGIGSRYHRMEIARVEQSARAMVAGYIENLGDHVREGRGILICGELGVGKTAILSLIAGRAFELNIDTRFCYAYDLHDSFFQRRAEDQANLYSWQRCRVLLLDEFGAAYENEFAASEVEGFVEKRQAAKLATCVASNLSAKAIRADTRWARVWDRWRSTCWTIEIVGESKREPLEGKP